MIWRPSHSPERMEMQHDTLWNEAVAFTRAKSPASFEQWFSGVQYDGMTDGVVSLRARDEFVREWVDQHFLPTLVDFLRSQTGWSIQIAWCVGGDLDHPVALGNGHPALPVRPRAMMPDRPIPPRPTDDRLSDHDARSGTQADGSATGHDNAPRSHRNGFQGSNGSNGSAANGTHSHGYANNGKASQPPPAIEGLNAKYTFGNFVVGPSNQLAHGKSVV